MSQTCQHCGESGIESRRYNKLRSGKYEEMEARGDKKEIKTVSELE